MSRHIQSCHPTLLEQTCRLDHFPTSPTTATTNRYIPDQNPKGVSTFRPDDLYPTMRQNIHETTAPKDHHHQRLFHWLCHQCHTTKTGQDRRRMQNLLDDRPEDWTPPPSTKRERIMSLQMVLLDLSPSITQNETTADMPTTVAP